MRHCNDDDDDDDKSATNKTNQGILTILFRTPYNNKLII